MVASPACPWDVSAGSGIRWMLVDELPFPPLVHSFNVMTWDSSKCFQLRISFAAADSARMVNFPPFLGSLVRVALWQWSLID